MKTVAVKVRSILWILAIVLLTSGCAKKHYSDVDTGTLKGKLLVEWYDNDKFIFIPDEADPLRFTRQSGVEIQPGKMYTDGGSIPRPLWALKNYSPWGYAPAYIVHDWLFEMKHCDLPGNENYDVKEAALVMSEIMKTLMEDPKYGGRNDLVMYSMYKAVSSPIAVDLWDNGSCDIPEVQVFKSQKRRPIFRYTIEYP